jgi:hypothetical protein
LVHVTVLKQQIRSRADIRIAHLVLCVWAWSVIGVIICILLCATRAVPEASFGEGSRNRAEQWHCMERMGIVDVLTVMQAAMPTEKPGHASEAETVPHSMECRV